MEDFKETSEKKFPIDALLFCSLIIMGLAILVGKFVFKSPNPTVSIPPAIVPSQVSASTNVTYSNPEVRISFSHPDRFSSQVVSGTQVVFAGVEKSDSFEFNYLPFSGSSAAFYEAYKSGEFSQYVSYGSNFSYDRQITVLGQPAGVYTTPAGTSAVFVSVSGTGYLFYFLPDSVSELDQILSSARMVN